MHEPMIDHQQCELQSALLPNDVAYDCQHRHTCNPPIDCQVDTQQKCAANEKHRCGYARAFEGDIQREEIGAATWR